MKTKKKVVKKHSDWLAFIFCAVIVGLLVTIVSVAPLPIIALALIAIAVQKYI